MKHRLQRRYKSAHRHICTHTTTQCPFRKLPSPSPEGIRVSVCKCPPRFSLIRGSAATPERLTFKASPAAYDPPFPSFQPVSPSLHFSLSLSLSKFLCFNLLLSHHQLGKSDGEGGEGLSSTQITADYLESSHGRLQRLQIKLISKLI